MGFVISLKDSILYNHSPITYGLLLNESSYIKINTKIMDLIEQSGALVLCKSNLPQILFSFESYNNYIGGVNNPYNHKRNSGGSSGGCGANMALGIGNIALVTDTAGSARIPAVFCGIFGFKPTRGVLPLDLSRKYMPNLDYGPKLKDNFNIVKPTVGLMSPFISNIKTFFDFLSREGRKVDRTVIPIVLKDYSSIKFTKIGCILPFSKLPVCPS